jgi:hypothetical protein
MSLITSLFLTGGTAAFAADQDQIQTQAQDQIQQQTQTRDQGHAKLQDRTRDRERIYGSQLMTPQERTEHRAKMRNMKTQQEREAFRLEHHKKMQERARERGVELPDEPPKGGQGMGPSGGMGPGGGGRKGR